jgi:hypothetical protein
VCIVAVFARVAPAKPDIRPTTITASGDDYAQQRVKISHARHTSFYHDDDDHSCDPGTYQHAAGHRRGNSRTTPRCAAYIGRGARILDPSIQTYLREAAVLFLLYMAWHLFRDRTRGVAAKSSVTWSRVFTTTLLNPKAFIFALVVIPFGTPYVGMYLVLFVCILLPISAAWILVGTLLGQAAHRENRERLARRLCAGVLGIFAVALFVSILPR